MKLRPRPVQALLLLPLLAGLGAVLLLRAPAQAAPRVLAADAFGPVVTAASAAETVIEVKTGEWYYTPKELTVAAGAALSLTLVHEGSAQIPHDIVFDLEGGQKAASKRIRGGEKDVMGFSAPLAPGEYVFYCSVGNHRARGMEGKLIVTSQAVFTVKTGEWYYDPKELKVAPSAAVSLTLVHEGSAQIPHDIYFVLEDGRVAATAKIRGGEMDRLAFVAPAVAGEYVFYCSVGNHRSRGMEGKLIVTGGGGATPEPGQTPTAAPSDPPTRQPEPTATGTGPQPTGTPPRRSIFFPAAFRNHP